MTTTDSNGVIRYQDSDGAPTPPVLNLGMQSVSDALTLVKRGMTKTVANSAALLAYAAEQSAAGKPPTATSPLFARQADTGQSWVNSGPGWVLQGPSRAAHQTLGNAPAGVDVPTAAVPDVNARMIRKTGVATFTTTTAFGNEYGPVITFSEPFPTSLLGVTMTQIHSGALLAFAGAMATDLANKNDFRALYVGSNSPTARGLIWEAVGY